MKNCLFLFAFFLHFCALKSQPFFKRYDSIVVNVNNTPIKNPWAGGLNFVQLSNIDLNLDGVEDLFVFDRSGNKVRTFINKSTTAGVVDLVHAPLYENKFPNLHDWALLVDYNCDGKADIFSYSDIAGGMKVYKNTSSIANGLQFVQVSPLVYSIFNPPGGFPINLYVSSVDIPAISDIDGDGDMDVVTFAITGSYMEYHINKSKELYGTCDSLKFEMKNRCWGYASEHPFNNDFTLDDTCIGNVSNPGIVTNNQIIRSENRHSGSCELCIDLNGDGDKDLIVGDIGADNLTMLTNGGTPTAGHFTAIDTAFPENNSSTIAVDLTLFPCAYYLDVNTDGKKDLLVSPNAPNLSQNSTSVIYYENIGTNSFPVFQFQQNDFLQNQMIEVGEGAYPALFDYDNDGLIDLFVGNYGYYASPTFENKIAYFRNTGTASVPKFDLITRDFNNMSSLGIINMIPAFGDLDGDGDADMIVGGYDGKIHYFQNIAPLGQQANFVLMQANMKNSNNRTIDVGDFAAPHIADVDGDGKKDLVIGARNGRLAFYKRLNSSGAPQMDSISHFWGNIKVNQFGYITGYSYPYVYKHAGKTELLVGSELGFLRRYDNIDGNLNGTFNMVDSTFHFIREGTRTAPTGADINNDGLWDLFVGNYSGGVSFYKGSATSSSIIENEIKWNFELFPNPANHVINIAITNAVNSKYKIDIYSALGQLISSEIINTNALTISAYNLKSGLYICKVSEISQSDSSVIGALVKRFVIQH